MARGLPRTHATTLRTFVDDISSISRGYEAWVLKVQRSTSGILLRGLREPNARSAKRQRS
eukprot:8750862-Karenia_brevis.AAC.1